MNEQMKPYIPSPEENKKAEGMAVDMEKKAAAEKASEDDKIMSRREFLKKAAWAGGALIAGAAGVKLATERGVFEEKIEKVGEGVILEKKHTPAHLINGAIPGTSNPVPAEYVFRVKINDEILNVYVSEEQFKQHNVNDSVPLKYKVGSDGKTKSLFRSPKLLDSNKE